MPLHHRETKELMMNKRGHLMLAACLAGGLSLALLGCEGSDDCSDSGAIGTWRTDSAERTSGSGGNWYRENITFGDTCVVEYREYEGNMRTGSGFYVDDGGELHLFFGEGEERTAEQDGDSMTMITHEDDSDDEWTLKLTRTSSTSPDSGPSGKCCQCRCKGCGLDFKIPKMTQCMDDCYNQCKNTPGCDPDPEQADDTSC
jgi:hypothetical protein